MLGLCSIVLHVIVPSEHLGERVMVLLPYSQAIDIILDKVNLHNTKQKPMLPTQGYVPQF